MLPIVLVRSSETTKLLYRSNTPDGAFNSSFNASWSASGINPAFLGFFPEMADDTYATIGLDGPAVPRLKQTLLL